MFKIPKIMYAQELIDKAFSRARKIRNKDKKKKTIDKISTVKNIISNNLRKYVKAFPDIYNIHPFYNELFDILIGMYKLDRAISSLRWADKKINDVARRGIKEAKRSHDYKKIIRMVYGRVSSVLYEIDESLKFLEDAKNKIQNVQFIDVNLPTVVIAGYPNVGKSSLLKMLSSAMPEIAPYPFTTKGLVVGHFYIEKKYDKIKVQVAEAPGLLDRGYEKRNDIEKQGIAALRYLPDVIVFIIDASGYPIESQEKLLQEIKREFKADVIVVENKIDISKGKTNYMKISCKTGEGIDELKKKIIEKLKK